MFSKCVNTQYFARRRSGIIRTKYIMKHITQYIFHLYYDLFCTAECTQDLFVHEFQTLETHPLVFDSLQLIELFFGDHESGQIGRIAGEEDECEQGPNAGQNSTGYPSRIVRVYRGAE